MRRAGAAIPTAILAALWFALPATVTADTVVLRDGRVITNCRILTEDDIGRTGVHGEWPKYIVDPEWIVIETEHGFWGFRKADRIDEVAAGPSVERATEPIRPVPVTAGVEPGVEAPVERVDANGIREIEAPMTVQQVRGRAYNVTLGNRYLVTVGDEIRQGQEVRVTWNSRLRGTIADRITFSAMEGTRFVVNRFWRHVRIGTEHHIDFQLIEGKVWLEVSSRLSNIDRVRFTINGNQLLTTKPMLMNVRMTELGQLQAAVFESRDVNIRFILPNLDVPVPLTVGKRVEISRERAELGSELDDVPLDPEERKEWDRWVAWQPREVHADPVLARPDVTGMPPLSYVPSLPEDDPGRNPRAVQPVRYRATFFALRQYRTGLRSYFRDVGDYPADNEAWVAALKVNPGVASWNGPYVDADLPEQDIWDNPFVYEKWSDAANTPRADVRSIGANGIDEFGFGDDLR